MSEKLEKVKIIGVGITSANEKEILEYVLEKLEKKTEPFFIVTPNPEILVHAHAHFEFKRILNEATVALPDGVGVVWASRVLAHPIKERITGVDFMENLCRKLSKKAGVIGLLGGRGSVAEEAAKRLQKKYPGVRVGFVGEEWNDEKFRPSAAKKKAGHSTLVSLRSQAISSAKGGLRPTSVTPAEEENEDSMYIDVLFVAYGFPKQEEWIHKNLYKFPAKCFMVVGGSFDVLSGNIRRAPRVFRVFGLEWLWRLLRQPWRWKRQLALITFVRLVLKEKFMPKTS